MAKKRITELATETTLKDGQYVAIDHTTDGTKKLNIGAELTDLKEDLEHISGISDDVKVALLQIAEKVAYIDTHGQTYYNDLYDALYPPTPATGISLSPSTLTFGALNTTQQITATLTPSGATSVISWESSDTSVATVSSSGVVTSVAEGTATITATANGHSATCSVTVEVATLSSISCVYTQSGTVYDNDSLDSLKAGLVVTAHWSNGTTSTVASSDYALSGTLTAGISTVTVTYSEKTTTFTVTVTHYEEPITYLYNWDFTNSLIDSVSNQEAEIKAGSGHNLPTRDSNGLSFIEPTQAVYLGKIDVVGKTIEIDIASFEFKGNTAYHIRLLSNNQYNSNNGYGLGAVTWRATSGQRGWTSYGYVSADGGNTNRKWSDYFWSSSLTGESTDVLNAFNGKTLKVVFHSDGHTKDLYVDGVLVGTIDDVYFNTAGTTHYSNKIYIAGSYVCSQGSGDQCYDMTITGIRVYANEE